MSVGGEHYIAVIAHTYFFHDPNCSQVRRVYQRNDPRELYGHETVVPGRSGRFSCKPAAPILARQPKTQFGSSAVGKLAETTVANHLVGSFFENCPHAKPPRWIAVGNHVSDPFPDPLWSSDAIAEPHHLGIAENVFESC